MHLHEFGLSSEEAGKRILAAIEAWRRALESEEDEGGGALIEELIPEAVAEWKREKEWTHLK